MEFRNRTLPRKKLSIIPIAPRATSYSDLDLQALWVLHAGGGDTGRRGEGWRRVDEIKEQDAAKKRRMI